VVHEIAEIFLGHTVGKPSPEYLEHAIENLATEETGVDVLVRDCLEGEGLAFSHLDTVCRIPFHSQDFAINAIYDLAEHDRIEKVAYAAAYLLNKVGAGSYTLERFVSSLDKIDGVMNQAIASESKPGLLQAVLRLYKKTSPLHKSSFYRFIHRNCHNLSDEQRYILVSMVTHPDNGPGYFGRDAAYIALKCVRDSTDIEQLWVNWINEGLFDGYGDSPCRAEDLATYIGYMIEEDLKSHERIIDTLKWHIIHLLENPNDLNAEIAIDHIFANSGSGYHERILLRDDEIGKDWGDSQQACELRDYVSSMFSSARQSETKYEAFR
jgi:hypothetical protein